MNDNSHDDFKRFLEEYGSLPQHTIGYAIPPPSTTREISDPAEYAQDLSGEMEPFGYYYIDCGPPDPELVELIKTAFCGGDQIVDGPTTHVFRQRICEEFIQSGVKEPIKDIIRRGLGQASCIVQGPVIVGHNPHPTDVGPKMAHPVSDAISLFRVVEGTIDPGQRAFSIYPTTHHQSPAEFQAHSVSGGQRPMNSATLLVDILGDQC
ncbi:Hypothetical protein PENO1_104980 [Penicillium occitanis (nom. inval.)]|nr:Hypothetical protein PENO1_104980 [Penicillium occitanis (nom. inval.)]PCG89688.1 hypothetical protein PENOC_105470 [Penicillium occitanis (nom. inval.)]